MRMWGLVGFLLIKKQPILKLPGDPLPVHSPHRFIAGAPQLTHPWPASSITVGSYEDDLSKSYSLPLSLPQTSLTK